MNLYPSIDILNGHCVRLYKGQYDQVSTYKSVMQQAELFANQGAETLHIIDLDGAKQGRFIHFETLNEIIKIYNFEIQTGGGIRTEEDIFQLFDHGVARVILGSFAILYPQQAARLITKFTEQIVLAVDFRIDKNGLPQVATHGWQQQHQQSLWNVLNNFNQSGLKHVLCTDINRDGTLLGPNIEIYVECIRRYPHMHFQASGGVSSLSDLQALKQQSLSAVIIGKALYEGKFTLQEAMNKVAYAC